MRILTIVFIICVLTGNAQKYSYYITNYRNNVPSNMLGVPGDHFKSTITFTNSSTATVYLHVKRTQKSIPLYWSLSYYYTQACSPSQDTIMVKIPAYSSSVLALNFKTDSVNTGVATASFKMYQTGLEDDAETFNLTATTMKATEVGIRKEVENTNIRIFPNPSNYLLNIVTTDQDLTAVTIYDALGTEKFNSMTVSRAYSVDVSQYPSGVYFVKVADGNTTYLRKIIRD